MSSFDLLFTCEHAGNRVPARHRALFRGATKTLASHRGWDIGSLELAKALQRHWRVPLLVTQVTRLLVEVNRSLGHAALFSEFSAPLAPPEKQQLLDRYYFPHRRRVEEHIVALLAGGRGVAHVSVHTFTPALRGVERTADVGLLYDPARKVEARFCTRWRDALREARPDLRVRRNYPYQGKADGLTTHLRRIFPADRYLGIELEVNQKWPLGPTDLWRKLKRDLALAFPAP